MDEDGAGLLFFVLVVVYMLIWAIPGGIAATRSKNWWYGVNNGIKIGSLGNIIKWWLVTLVIGSIGTAAFVFALGGQQDVVASFMELKNGLSASP